MFYLIRAIIGFFLIYSSITANSQPVFYPALNRSVVSARYSEVVNNAMVCSSNPAMLPQIKSIEAVLFTEKRFMTSDINYMVFALAAGFNDNGIGLIFRRFGNTEYFENSYAVCYGKKLGCIQLGMLINQVIVKISGSPRSSFVQAGIYSLFELSDHVYGSVQISNPRFFIPVRSDRVRLASSYIIGAGWQASSQVYAGVESVKEEARAPEFIVTAAYQFAKNLQAGINWSTATNQPYIYTSWNHKRFRLQAGCSFHSSLGPSPAITFFYNKVKMS